MRFSGSRISTALRAVRAARPQRRCLATPSSSKTQFSHTLEDGPSLDDFIADRVPDRVVLGNAKACVKPVSPDISNLNVETALGPVCPHS